MWLNPVYTLENFSPRLSADRVIKVVNCPSGEQGEGRKNLLPVRGEGTDGYQILSPM